MKKKKLFTLFVLLLFLSSCAPYVMVGGQYAASSENFVVDLPEGWRRHEIAFDQGPISRKIMELLEQRRKLSWDVIRITRDGLLLQQISIGRVPVDDELPHTKKKLSREMLPQEAAEIVIDNLRSNPNITNQEVIENTPTRVGGNPGFKLLYTYQTKEGLKIKAAYYGAMSGNWLYYLLYEAPARHYFDKDHALFEKIKESFKLLKEGMV
jgi:hypothetical protein